MLHTFGRGTSELLAVTQAANQRSCRLLERLGLTVDHEFEEFGALQRLYKATLTDLRPAL
jgi:RimJ/RimL family protein N-acetyltransferase